MSPSPHHSRDKSTNMTSYIGEFIAFKSGVGDVETIARTSRQQPWIQNFTSYHVVFNQAFERENNQFNIVIDFEIEFSTEVHRRMKRVSSG